MKIIETHCHLDYLKQLPLEEIVQKCKEVGIEKIITIGVAPENLDTVFEISNNNDLIYFSQGIHPHDAKDSSKEAMEKISQRTSEEKMVAVGEIGLDYHYDNSPRKVQLAVFEEQLQIAVDKKKPVIIHSRDADDDMIAMLNEYAPKLDKKGVIHSFTSTRALAKKAIDEGFYLGFNGIITFKKAEEVRENVVYAPIENLLIETDSPFLTPVPHRGKENAPYYLPFILEKMAELKNLSPEVAAKHFYENSMNLFFRT
jgi:TatD DNase family protein